MSVKNQILDTAVIVFSKSGYYTATVDDIAKEAGIAKGSIYYHFKSKEDLFITIIESGINHIIFTFDEITKASSTINEATAKCIDFVMEYYIQYPALCSLFFCENTSGMSDAVISRMKNIKTKLNQSLASLLEEGSKCGMVHKIDFELAAVLIYSMLNGVCRKILEDVSADKLLDTKEVVMQTLFNGILIQSK